MSEPRQDTRQGAAFKLDMVINIPTILTFLALFASAMTYLNNQLSALNNAQLINAGDVKVLQTRMSAVELGLSTARADMVSSRSESSTQINTLRTEIRGDLRDLKESLDRINDNTNNRGH